MRPILVAIAGPQRGTVFTLEGDQTSIGRDSSNFICLTDRSASRKHCIVSKEIDDFVLKDLGSRHGTFLNGIPAQRRKLEDGDKIDIGDSSFLFLTTYVNSPSSEFTFSEVDVLTTTRLRVEESPYLKPEQLLSSAIPANRIAQGLSAILKFSHSIQAIRDIETLPQEILRSAFEITPAERGSVIFLDTNSGEIISVYTCDRSLKKLNVPVSSTVLKRVINEGYALLSNDVQAEQTIVPVKGNELSSNTKAIVVAPMIRADRNLGIIYMDTSDSLVRFDEEHLRLISAVAAIGAIALENLRYIEILRLDQQRMIEDARIHHNLIGESARLKQVIEMIQKAAPTDSTVLICGESGTGKELAARAVHLNSPRCNKPFVAINCANLSESLLESELFGHEKGAFTGAVSQKKGKLEIADGGTVFLDEIAELAPALQSRILRVLQEREFERVGGTRSIKINIRLIAATNKDLKEAMRTEKFRQDLYYRLNVVQIQMPPLRERREDIHLLASFFASKHGRKSPRGIVGISPEARGCLTNYDWPGNVRQLENVIERAIVLGTEDVIRVEDFSDEVMESNSNPITKYQETLSQTKKKLILESLEQAKGNLTDAAKTLGVHPNNLRQMMNALNLQYPTVK